MKRVAFVNQQQLLLLLETIKFHISQTKCCCGGETCAWHEGHERWNSSFVWQNLKTTYEGGVVVVVVLDDHHRIPEAPPAKSRRHSSSGSSWMSSFSSSCSHVRMMVQGTNRKAVKAKTSCQLCLEMNVFCWSPSQRLNAAFAKHSQTGRQGWWW